MSLKAQKMDHTVIYIDSCLLSPPQMKPGD